MKKNTFLKLKQVVWTAVVLFCVIIPLAPPTGMASAVERHEKPIHGGELQMIGECRIGHTEIIVDEGTVEIWISSGGRGVLKPVTIPDKTIGMKAYIEGSKIPKTLILNAAPLDPSESVGSCSHFIGHSEELKNPGTRFRAVGKIIYNGAKLDMVIDFPLEDGKPY